jgi:hypothetical protein
MAAGKSSQSPQAERGSSQDYEQFSKGEVQMPTTKHDDNEHAWEIHDEPDYKPKY